MEIYLTNTITGNDYVGFKTYTAEYDVLRYFIKRFVRLDTGVSDDGSYSQEGPVISPWQPVQGQKRSSQDKQKRASTGSSKHDKQKGNCKQQ